MYRSAHVILIALFLSATVGAAAKTTGPATSLATSRPAARTFTDERQTYFVTVPGDWRAMQPPKGRGGMLLIGPAVGGKAGATPIFRVQAGQQQVGAVELTIDAFARDVVRQVTGKAPDDVKVEPLKLGGIDARQFKVEKADSKGVAVAMHYVLVLVQPRSFLFTYIQERDLYDPAEAQAVFGSITWGQNGPTTTTTPTTTPTPTSAPATQAARAVDRS